MKVVFFIASVFFLALGGLGYTYAETSETHTQKNTILNLVQKQDLKVNLDGQSLTIAEETEIDFEEEHSNDTTKTKCKNNLFDGEYNLPSKWNATSLRLSKLKFYQENFKILPYLLGHSNPLYIIHRVFRI
jgi:hypothetical protein